MNDFEQINIKREWIHQASEIARKCSSESVRERVLVSQTAALAAGDFLRRKYNLPVTDGRSSEAKFIELLDVCDFNCNNWLVETRALMDLKISALYIPTMPLMVGFFSDFYLCLQVNQNLSQATIFGFASEIHLSEAELTPNGMFAVVPLEALAPVSALASELRKPKPDSLDGKRKFEEWERKANRILQGLSNLLTEETFSFAQKERLSSILYDEVLQIFAGDDNSPKFARLVKKVFERFEIEPAIPSSPESEIVFRNQSKAQQKLQKSGERQKFFTQKLPVEKRVNLYRYLIENNQAFTEHRRTKKIFDQITDGNFQTSSRRQSRKRLVKRKTETVWVEPPPKDSENEQNTD